MAGSDYKELGLWSEYRVALDAYAAALAAGSGGIVELLETADAIRRRLIVMDPVNGVTDSMHLTLGYSYAAGAGATAEAERLYKCMSVEDQKSLDVLDAAEPGSFKIWLRPGAAP